MGRVLRYCGIAAVIVLTLGLGQCPVSQLGVLEEKRGLWESLAIDDYRYTFRRSCFCIPDAVRPVIVQVIDGETESIVDADTMEPVDNTFFDDWRTIDLIFDRLQSTLESATGTVQVTYDPDFGFPATVSADPIRGAIDDEFATFVTEFEVLAQ